MLTNPDFVKLLQCTYLGGNNNKWWKIEWWQNGDTRITFGRVGDKCSKPTFKKMTMSQVLKKIEDKKKASDPGSRYVEVELNTVEISYQDTCSPKIKSRIDKIFQASKESLNKTSTTDFNLSEDQLTKGSEILYQLSKNPSTSLLESYFNLVPTVLPRKIDPNKELKRILSSLQEEQDRIESLINTVKSNKILIDGGSLFDQLGASLEEIELEPLETWLKNTNPHGLRFSLKEAYNVNTLKETHDVSGVELFHATKRENVKPILMTGLICPKYPSNGRMFGQGIYLADMCSKSLNYTEGRGEVYLFTVKADLGNPYKTTKTVDWSSPPDGYNSLIAEKGTIQGAWSGSLRYNEYVVYNKLRQKLSKLLILEL